jgi:thymidylate kinase
VLGEQFVKNYRIPLEKQFLDFTRIVYDVKIPVPELEIIILSIRALLKYRDRDVVKDIFSIRSPGIPEHILHEILWLLDQTSSEKIIDTFSSISDFSDGKIILSFLEIVNRAPRSGWKLFRLRSRLRRELRNHQRQNRFAATINYFQSLLKKSKIFSAGKDQRLKFPERGKLIALIGIDGSGKSTLSAELAKWLEWKISAPLYYLGSKQPSVWSDWSYIGFRIFRRSNTILSKWIKADRLLIKIIQRFRQFFLALHYLSVGVDRYKRYKTAKKEVEEGSVIIFDRFPFVSPLDGPEIHLISEGKLFFFTRKLSEIEKRLYRKFDYLDFITVLDVNPEVSIERKPDHSMETIVAKNVALSQLKTDLSKAPEQWNWISIDSDLPIDQVLLNIKAAVWSQL